MNMSENINEITTALSKFQAEVTNPTKNLINPAYGSKYADFMQIIKSIKEPLAKNGLSIMQDSGSNEESIWVQTLIMHNSGQWLKSEKLSMINKKEVVYNEKSRNANGKYINIITGKENLMYTIQDVGSILTYLKRYQLTSMLCIPSDDDDDGNTLSQQQNRFSYEDKNKSKIEQDQKNKEMTIHLLSLIKQISDVKKIDKEKLVNIATENLGKKSTKDMNNDELEKFINILKGE